MTASLLSFRVFLLLVVQFFVFPSGKAFFSMSPRERCLPGSSSAACNPTMSRAGNRFPVPESLFSISPTQTSLQSTFHIDSDGDGSTSLDFAMDPASPEAVHIVRETLGLSLEQHQQLAALAVLVVDWNSKINLISRKDCTKEVVFGRHILPSLAFLGMDSDGVDREWSLPRQSSDEETFKVVDVGTGGGFPGLPLAIAYPHIDFLLVDSVGKKLTAVQDMADQLGLTNVKTHHGRAEVLPGTKEETTFDVCVGRSVAAIPTYCFWIQSLLAKDTGRLLYMIGGDIEDELLEQTSANYPIDNLLGHGGASDKNIVVFAQPAVSAIAAASGEKIRVATPSRNPKHKKKKNQRSKGEWKSKRDRATPGLQKQRGYENFQRFDSLGSG